MAFPDLGVNPFGDEMHPRYSERERELKDFIHQQSRFIRPDKRRQFEQEMRRRFMTQHMGAFHASSNKYHWVEYEFNVDFLLESEITALRERAAVAKAQIRLSGKDASFAMPPRHADITLLTMATMLAQDGVDPTQPMIQSHRPENHSTVVINGTLPGPPYPKIERGHGRWFFDEVDDHAIDTAKMLSEKLGMPYPPSMKISSISTGE